jgi:hypothetical protein
MDTVAVSGDCDRNWGNPGELRDNNPGPSGDAWIRINTVVDECLGSMQITLLTVCNPPADASMMMLLLLLSRGANIQNTHDLSADY